MENKRRLTHIGDDGRAQMVDVSDKPPLTRTAIASGRISLTNETLQLISEGENPKGDVLAVARIAGIQAAKRASELIPLCHPLPLSSVAIDITMREDGLEVQCTARTVAQTGVEMEALTGVSVALLTVYDMCKAVDKQMKFSDIRLVKKTKEAL